MLFDSQKTDHILMTQSGFSKALSRSSSLQTLIDTAGHTPRRAGLSTSMAHEIMDDVAPLRRIVSENRFWTASLIPSSSSMT
jgi:hypothetical protein